METDLVLDLPRGLDQSILLAVMLGMLVMLFLTEMYGWVYVGVVVPGYLTSIMVIQPAAGAAVFLDAVLTYLVARIFAEVAARTGAGATFFGRERFFLVVLVSVLVRQHTQSWVMPYVLEQASAFVDVPIEVNYGFYSIGLVLVPLTANIMWKLELRRGLFQLVVVLLATYLLLEHVLLANTTMSLSSVEITYENTALDFLGSGKAYVVMLSAGYLAAYFNLRYGWDFSGILVPALLALLWLHPAKLAVTLAESVALFWMLKMIPKLPGFGTFNLEGPRKISLAFTLGIMLKWVVAALVGPRFPAIKVTDLFGFGYLLSSLLAVKMLQRKSVRGVLLPTVFTSIAGFGLGNVLGFILELLIPSGVNEPPVDREVPPTRRLSQTGRGVAAAAAIRAGSSPRADRSHAALVAWDRVWAGIELWLDEPVQTYQWRVAADAQKLGLRIEQVEGVGGERQAFMILGQDRRLAIHRRWETALLVPGAPGPVIAVPRPATEEPVAELAPRLCLAMACRAILFAGSEPKEEDGEVRGPPGYELALSRLEGAPIVELRADEQLRPGTVRFHVGGGVPEHVPLDGLWGTEVVLDWSPPPEFLGERPSVEGIRVMRFHPDDVRAALAADAPPRLRAEDLYEWVARHYQPDAASKVGLDYVAPSPVEQRFFEDRLVAHALRVATAPRGSLDLDLLSHAAAAIGYGVWEVDRCGAARGCLILAEAERATEDGWGTVVVRRGGSDALAVEVPRPWKGHGTLHLGTQLWANSGGRILVVAGADDGKGDHDPDPSRHGNLFTAFQAAHQAVDRYHEPDGRRPLIVQIRALAKWRKIETDLVVGLGHPVLNASNVPERLRALFESNAPLSWVDQILISDGSPDLFELAGDQNPQLEYSAELAGTDVALLWFSPEIRRRYRTYRHAPERERLKVVGMGSPIRGETGLLLKPVWNGGWTGPNAGVRKRFAELMRLARDYEQTQNLHALRSLMEAAEDPRVSVEAGMGAQSGWPFLMIDVREKEATIRGVLFLGLEPDGTVVEVDAGAPRPADQIRRAMYLRRGAIAVRGNVEQMEVKP